ncbi:hypothetical protein FT662_05358 [Candidozyma haemuli var. vulneris]|nr:hypothetical protein FT662_05358 [[Candida] haemuloni var. vulneris]
MFSKRPDKHTAGLINMRNDCFANASVQAYSSLPGFTEYLNTFITVYGKIFEMTEKYKIALETVISPDDILSALQSKASRQRYDVDTAAGPIQRQFQITLHVALAKMIKKLQDTQMSTRTLSVWTFLHELERIYNAKISRSQHDAHELTQLINETLEAENIVCMRISKKLRELLALQGVPQRDINAVDIPEFPFSGLLMSQMNCLTCAHVSKPSFSPFLMLTLHLPQSPSSDLISLLDDNESETISEYQCLKCRISAIINCEKMDNSFDDNKQMSQLAQLDNDPNLFINEDIPPSLEAYIKGYSKKDFKADAVSSTVHRKTSILKPPEVFGIHLSRSTFNGVSVTRNPCRVTFNDKLSLSIGHEYVDELQKFQNSDPEGGHTVRGSNVLTTDVDDMEDESVQQEDVDEQDYESTSIENSDTDEASYSMDDSDSSSVLTDRTRPPSLETENTSRGLVDGRGETLNNTPMSEGQTVSLKRHFRKFNFDENNTYKYRLRAMIKHQGSHTQGHYECFKRKPLFVKDTSGNILKIAQEIDEEALANAQRHTNINEGTKGTHQSIDSGQFEDGPGALRNKLSSLMGRRHSITQTDPTCVNLQEIPNSGTATPAEVLVDHGDYFSGPSTSDLDQQLHRMKLSEGPGKDKVKMKKIPSSMKHPYWKVGDSQVAEVSKSSVLLETASVYMLYYERIDRNSTEVR